MSQLILENHPLAPLTTWRIGGAAARLAAPADLEDVWRLMRLAHDRGWPLFFLGRGSNVLIDDAGLPGLTLHLAKSLQNLTPPRRHLEGRGRGLAAPAGPGRGPAGFRRVRVSGRHPRHRGRGGAPQRRGRGPKPGRGPEAGLGGHASTATPGIDAPGTGPGLPRLAPAELPPLAGGGGGVPPVAPCRTRGHQGSREGVDGQRRGTGSPPTPEAAAASSKTRRPGRAAGWLIEAAGFKGHRLGDAVVSRKHAKALSSTPGRATAAQVKALMAEIEEKVWQTQGVALEREVVWLPGDLA